MRRPVPRACPALRCALPRGARARAGAFQVPRRGYVAAVACERCHARGGVPGAEGRWCCRRPGPCRCGWCAAASGPAVRFLRAHGLRALVTGAGRTAEELGRAFPARADLGPGRGPGQGARLARGGRGDAGSRADRRGGIRRCRPAGWLGAPGRASLRAAEEALRRWMNAAALVRPGRRRRRHRGGRLRAAGGPGPDPLGPGHARGAGAGRAAGAPVPPGCEHGRVSGRTRPSAGPWRRPCSGRRRRAGAVGLDACRPAAPEVLGSRPRCRRRRAGRWPVRSGRTCAS